MKTPGSTNSDPVVVAALRRVASDQATAAEQVLAEFQAFAVRQPGCEGMQFTRRDLGGEVEFSLIGRFVSTAARETFKQHPSYPDWLRRLDAGALRPAEIIELHGLEAWFDGAPTAAAGGGPPVWKMALVTYLGVNLVTTPLLLFLPHWLSPLPFPWSNFAFNLFVVGILTWIAMPLLTRWTRRWLNSPP